MTSFSAPVPDKACHSSGIYWSESDQLEFVGNLIIKKVVEMENNEFPLLKSQLKRTEELLPSNLTSVSVSKSSLLVLSS